MLQSAILLQEARQVLTQRPEGSLSISDRETLEGLDFDSVTYSLFLPYASATELRLTSTGGATGLSVYNLVG